MTWPESLVLFLSCGILEQNQLPVSATSGLYYKPMTIVNGGSGVINKLEASLTDNATVIIYDRHMFIVQATGGCTGSGFLNRYVVKIQAYANYFITTDDRARKANFKDC